MTQQTSPFLEGKFGWALGESNWNLGMDENLLKFSFMFDKNIDGIVATLPAPVNGTAYFLTTDNRIYFVVNGSYYSTPTPKWFLVALRATGNVYQFNGTTLVQVDSPVQVDGRLDAIESSKKISLLETQFTNLITVKPTPSNPATWDWTPAIQAWVNYLVANAKAGIAPSGTYLHNQINLPTGNLDIWGEGWGSTSFGPFSANQTLFYKDQTPLLPTIDERTNARPGFHNLGFVNEAGLVGCRAVFMQGVYGANFDNILFRKLDKALEFNRCEMINILNIFWYKGGRFIFDASPYRKIAPSTYDYTKTVNIVNVMDLFGLSDLGGNPWFHFRDTVNVQMQNVQSPALMGTAQGIKIEGSCEGIYAQNCILVWPTIGVNMVPGLIDVGSGTPDTAVEPEYCNFVSVAVDQPSQDGWFMSGDYWNMESCLVANGVERGTTGNGIQITGTSRYFNISKTLVRGCPADGIRILSGARDGCIRDCDIFNNATVSGAQIEGTLITPNAVEFKSNRVVGTVTVAGSRLVGGNTSSIIYKDSGAASTPASVTPTDLMTYTIPIGTLKIGQKVRLTAYGTLGANTNAKTVRLWFGASSLGGLVSSANGVAWRASADVDLISAGVQEYIRNGDTSGISPGVGTGSLAINEALAVIVKVQGENGTATAADIICQHFSVELIN